MILLQCSLCCNKAVLQQSTASPSLDRHVVDSEPPAGHLLALVGALCGNRPARSDTRVHSSLSFSLAMQVYLSRSFSMCLSWSLSWSLSSSLSMSLGMSFSSIRSPSRCLRTTQYELLTEEAA